MSPPTYILFTRSTPLLGRSTNILKTNTLSFDCPGNRQPWTNLKKSDIILSIVFIQRRKKCFDPNTKFRKEGKINLLNTIEEIVKTLDFNKMEDDKGAKSKEHADDRISKSDMKTSSKYTTNKNVSQLNVHII